VAVLGPGGGDLGMVSGSISSFLSIMNYASQQGIENKDLEY